MLRQHLENWIERKKKSKATEGMHERDFMNSKKANCGKL